MDKKEKIKNLKEIEKEFLEELKVLEKEKKDLFKLYRQKLEEEKIKELKINM